MTNNQPSHTGGVKTIDELFKNFANDVQGKGGASRRAYISKYRRECEALMQDYAIEARIEETEYWRKSGFLPLFDADKRLSKLQQLRTTNQTLKGEE